MSEVSNEGFPTPLGPEIDNPQSQTGFFFFEIPIRIPEHPAG